MKSICRTSLCTKDDDSCVFKNTYRYRYSDNKSVDVCLNASVLGLDFRIVQLIV